MNHKYHNIFNDTTQVVQRIIGQLDPERRMYDRVHEVLSQAGSADAIVDVSQAVSTNGLHYYTGHGDTSFENHMPTVNFYSQTKEEELCMDGLYGSVFVYIQSLAFGWVIPNIANIAALNANGFAWTPFLVGEVDLFAFITERGFYFKMK
jgi:hypothetical protein